MALGSFPEEGVDADGEFGKDGTGPELELFMPKSFWINFQIVMGITHPSILPTANPPANIPVPKNPLHLRFGRIG
jgi:hypothetical protein